MIVDDEPFIREGLKYLIDWNKYGYEISGDVGDGKSAIELLKTSDINVVITDVKMPEMNGLELISYVKKNISDKIKFIILSGYGEFNYAKQAIQYGVSDYILKPIQREELIEILMYIKNEWLEERKAEQSKEAWEQICFQEQMYALIQGNQSI